MAVEERCEKCESRQRKTVICTGIENGYEYRDYICDNCNDSTSTLVVHTETHFDATRRQKGEVKW